MSDVVKLAQDLIRFPSITPKEAGVLDFLERELTALGFTCHRLPFGEGTEQVDNLFARLGTTAPHVCFAGHTDVVPPGDESSWKHPPFSANCEKNILYGRGAVDMKGAIACFLSALKTFLQGKQPTGSLSFLITNDEEGPAKFGTKPVLEWMKENGHIPDFCLVGEPTSEVCVGDTIKIGRRGSLNAVITETGTQGHVAYPQKADNPIPRMLEYLQVLEKHTFDEGDDYFAPTNLEITTVDVNNPTTNVIPQAISARLNIRFNAAHTGESLVQFLEDTAKNHLNSPTLDCQISGEAFYTQPNSYIQTIQNAVQKVTGKVAQLSTSGGTSDARFIQVYCSVAELGLLNKTAHKVDEHVTLDQLKELEKIYLNILKSLC